MAINDLKIRIRNLLFSHTGEKTAIKRRHILEELGIQYNSGTERKARRAIAELRDAGFPILFSAGDPQGYYLPANQAELDEGMDRLRRIIKDECITLRHLKVKGPLFIKRTLQGRLI